MEFWGPTVFLCCAQPFLTPSSKMAAPPLLTESTFQTVENRKRKQTYWLEFSHMTARGWRETQKCRLHSGCSCVQLKFRNLALWGNGNIDLGEQLAISIHMIWLFGFHAAAVIFFSSKTQMQEGNTINVDWYQKTWATYFKSLVSFSTVFPQTLVIISWFFFRDGLIKAIGPADAIQKMFSEETFEERIDCSGKCILPGINLFFQ